MDTEENKEKNELFLSQDDIINSSTADVESAYQDLLQMLVAFDELDKMANFKEMKSQMKLKKQLARKGFFIHKQDSQHWSPLKGEQFNNIYNKSVQDIKKVNK